MAILLKPKIQRKRRVPCPVDPHGFESVGDILRRMRREAERQMTGTFDRALSLRLDQLLAQEETCQGLEVEEMRTDAPN